MTTKLCERLQAEHPKFRSRIEQLARNYRQQSNSRLLRQLTKKSRRGGTKPNALSQNWTAEPSELRQLSDARDTAVLQNLDALFLTGV